jgi:hypothetical protein
MPAGLFRFFQNYYCNCDGFLCATNTSWLTS